jgi:hypothetical protein
MGTQFWRGDGPTLQKPKGGSPAVEERGAEVDYQVAAPAEMRTPNLHRAKIAQQRSADGRTATEAARLERNDPQEEEKLT